MRVRSKLYRALSAKEMQYINGMDQLPQSLNRDSALLDEVNSKLITQLKRDGRQSLVDLGAAIGLSGEAVRDRLHQLTNAGIVKVTCSVDPRILGFTTISLVGLKVAAPAEQIAEEIAQIAEFDFVACTAGEFDIIVEAVCQDDLHLLRVIDAGLRSRSDVVSLTSFNYLKISKFSTGVGDHRFEQSQSYALDEIDLKIISTLQQDGRLGFQELAAIIKVPYQTTRRRTKLLFENNVLTPEVLVNRVAEGSAVIAAVHLRTSGPIPPIVEKVKILKEVEIVVHTSGSVDLMLEVACRDREHLAELVGTTLPAIPGIVSTETNIYLRVVKLPQTWPGLVRHL